VRLRHLLPGEMQPAPPLSDQAGLPEAPAH
jgi:hypothetical protein